MTTIQVVCLILFMGTMGTMCSCDMMSDIGKGVYGAKKFGRHHIMTDDLRSTTFGIKDAVEDTWAFRIDSAHKNVPHPHININPKLSKMKDPHFRLPKGSDVLGSAATGVLDTAASVAYYASLLKDTANMVVAAAEDLDEMGRGRQVIPKKTVVAGSGIAGGYGGACVGSSIGASIGGTIGTAVGFLFGGVGALPGQALGSSIGALIGGVTGAGAGSEIVKAFTEEVLK